MFLFAVILFLCNSALSLSATQSLQWNVDFRRNVKLINNTLTYSNNTVVFFIKIQDNNDYSSSIHFKSVLQLIQPLLTLKFYLPQHYQSTVKKILPSLCLSDFPSLSCEAPHDLKSIIRFCHTHRQGSSPGNAHFCREGSNLEWIWLAEYHFPDNYTHTLSIFATVESNSFGIEIPDIRLNLLLFPMSTLQSKFSVILPLVPYSLTANNSSNLVPSSLIGGSAISLLNGDILIQQQGYLYMLDWSSSELLPVTDCLTQEYPVISIEVLSNGILASTKYGVLWIEKGSDGNFTLYRDGDTTCAGDLFYEEREPYLIKLYSFHHEKGDIRVMGNDVINYTGNFVIQDLQLNNTMDGKFESVFPFNLWDEISQIYQIDNATILSFLNDWITEELLILISDSEDTTSLIRFDLVGYGALNHIKLPQHLPQYTGNNGGATLLYISSNNSDTNHSLIIRDMKVLSNSEILLWGTRLLYSPDFGDTLYYFSKITDPISRVEVLPTGRFIVITQQHQIWYSSVGNLQLQQLFPYLPDNTTNLYQLISNSILEITTLSTSKQPEVSRYQLTTLPEHNYSPQNCSSAHNLTHQVNLSYPLLSPESWVTALSLTNASDSCAYYFLSLFSSHCVALTREVHQFSAPIQDIPDINPYSYAPYPALNCTRTGDGFPPHIYLDKSSQFNTSLLIHMLPRFSCMIQNDTAHDIPRVSVWFSRQLLEARSQLDYNYVSHTFTYSIFLTVNQTLSAKLLTGRNLDSSEIKLKIYPINPNCSELESEAISTVFVGCPSSLSIMYDYSASENNDMWIKPDICDEHPNMSCLYFDFGFIPQFFITDELLESRTPFEGFYNLKPIAAGLSLDRMTNFSNVTTPLGLWAIKDSTDSPIQLHTQLAAELQWICIHGSFCADINPSPQYGISVYFLTLEFSNSLDRANTSFCNFTTQFTVLIYGVPLGPMGTIVSFVVSLIFYLLVLFCGYPIYLVRGRIQKYYTTHIYNNLYGLVENVLTKFTRLRLDFHVKKRSNKVQAS